MEYRISNRLAALKPSAIREIFKATDNPSIVPFALGNPAPESFPVEVIRTFTKEILDENPAVALQYGITEGYAPLCALLRERMRDVYHCGREGDDLIVVSGAQQGAELAAKALCDEGDTVLCENPSFIGVLNAFRSLRVNLKGIPLHEDGLDIEALEQALRTEQRVRMLYIIPNFQNPSGITTSLEKRRAVYALARKYNIIILEDNPYGELRFAGEDLPHIKSMDEDGRVIYLGTFSKILSAGLRVGYVLGPAPVLQKMVVAKQGEDVHTAMLSQMIAARFLAWNGFAAHLERVRTLYREKCGRMLDGIRRYFDPRITHTTPQGGLFLWCTLPEGMQLMDYCKAAIAKGVAVVPGTAFLPDTQGQSQSFRLTFAAPSEEQIEQGLRLLGGIPLQ
ncbi:PLP-dependent aminotransferase family protein [Ethanoligenens harbinense]|uniref:Putative transcriptional regulator, GntR family n=1 Tax=Ethanoligenens harbinense (strain DSM 18485 / JCM 12961 / CGMCC 1.5033 / YUAN-3) TaxID=663278 RepID=E6U794_ETHHY|nr:PLP-dependent aminotransferase family protein [Ethanoligenens harbinense]ADU25829.1 putative transcriptional regulator, GntR family [Ethanoligenens harbinense YUAN-3]AVQ94990.1 PLP-dependent aminotransferase family protein [Ethanoligenens harbinense YUAN-3]AYF37682.1 PLP-dependent aminotransferase family protein [Ethanoligenens harbinense]AYF40402.1 PLP-dependent aminotransferase family protein [Ethanoligenens harbinense]QCN91237.1 PLP-dependent aminotransferase family protein [Ethanoligene